MMKMFETIAGKEPVPAKLNDYWKRIAIITMLASSVIGFTCMLITNMISGESTAYIIMNIVGIISTIGLFIILRTTNNIELFSFVFIFILFTASLYAYITIEAPRFEHMITLLLPMVSIFLFERKPGIYIPIAYYLTILFLEIIFGYFGVKFFVQYSLYFLILTFFPCFIAYSRDRTHEMLEITHKEKAIYDSQTELYSKSYISSIVEEKITEEEFYLLMIDIDNFKDINDTHGHVFGDECINLLAETLKDCIRDGCCGRFGGDEFIALLTHKENLNFKQHLAELHESLTDSLSKLGFTISMGAVKSNKKDSASKLIYLADTSLYQAKAQGKNQLIVYSR